MTKKQKRMIEDMRLMFSNVIRGIPTDKNAVSIDFSDGTSVTVEERENGCYFNKECDSMIATVEQIKYIRHKKAVKEMFNHERY